MLGINRESRRSARHPPAGDQPVGCRPREVSVRHQGQGHHPQPHQLRAFPELEEGSDGMIHVPTCPGPEDQSTRAKSLKKGDVVEAVVPKWTRPTSASPSAQAARRGIRGPTSTSSSRSATWSRARSPSSRASAPSSASEHDIDGLVHISRSARKRVDKIKNVLRSGTTSPPAWSKNRPRRAPDRSRSRPRITHCQDQIKEEQGCLTSLLAPRPASRWSMPSQPPRRSSATSPHWLITARPQAAPAFSSKFTQLPIPKDRELVFPVRRRHRPTPCKVQASQRSATLLPSTELQTPRSPLTHDRGLPPSPGPQQPAADSAKYAKCEGSRSGQSAP